MIFVNFVCLQPLLKTPKIHLMKKIFLILLLFTFKGQAQWKSYLISIKGDTINCIDQKGLKQGKWVIRTDELRGEPGFEEEGVFENDKREGLWRKYNLSGDLIALENYKWGLKDGKQQYFTMLGDLQREESWYAANPEHPIDTIEVPDLYNPGKVETKIIKHEVAEVRHGTWKYYDPSTGFITKTERYFFGQLEKDGLGNTAKPANNSASAQQGSTHTSKKPKEVLDWEKKNAGKKKIKYKDGSTSGG